MRVYDPEPALFYELDELDVRTLDYESAYSGDERNMRWLLYLSERHYKVQPVSWPLNRSGVRRK